MKFNTPSDPKVDVYIQHTGKVSHDEQLRRKYLEGVIDGSIGYVTHKVFLWFGVIGLVIGIIIGVFI